MLIKKYEMETYLLSIITVPRKKKIVRIKVSDNFFFFFFSISEVKLNKSINQVW